MRGNKEIEEYKGKVNDRAETEENLDAATQPTASSAGPYSFPSSGDFCRLLITSANSLAPDQARHFVRPNLDTNCLTLWWYSRKIFF